MASLNSHIQTDLNGLTAKDVFLKNPYLMAQTFSHLQVENDKESRLCLFNAALTCKDFLDTALDVLWEELDSLVPLLKLLPALQVEDKDYVLSGNVSQADWDRLEYYSRRVKVFQVITLNTNHPQVVPSTYFRIAQLQSSALLPSLRHLRYSLHARPISHIFLLISPSLESVEFTNIIGSENTLVGPFLATLPSPMLNRIVLRTGRMSADTFARSIAQFKKLRSLELSHAVFMNDFVLREVLGTLPFLENLNLKGITSEPRGAYVSENSNNEREGPKRFSTLEHLSVTGPFLLVRDLFNFVESPCLKSIEIHPVDIDSGSKRKQLTLFLAMVGSKWPHSLESFVIGLGNSNLLIEVEHRYTFPTSTIMLLAALHQMQTFHLKDWRIGNTDDDVRHLVISWPKLTTLILPVDQLPISSLTLRTIAENCPGLRYLQIQLDVSTMPSSDTTSVTLHHKLRVMSVGSDPDAFLPTRTKLQCQIRVARHLDSLFPYLESIKTHLERNSAGIWSDIHKLVKLCQDVRHEEAKRRK